MNVVVSTLSCELRAGMKYRYRYRYGDGGGIGRCQVGMRVPVLRPEGQWLVPRGWQKPRQDKKSGV